LHPLTFSVLIVNNFRIPGTADLIAYLEQTPACLTQLPHLPDDLSSYQVIVVDPFHIKANKLHRLQQFVGAGGGCLGITSTIPGDRSAARIFGALPKDAGLECEVRVLFTNRANPLGVRLPDAFYISGPFLPLTMQDNDVEVVLYVDWRYTHQPVLTCRSFGMGTAALTTIQDLNHPTFKRILYRLLRRLASLEEPSQPLQVGLLGYPPSVGELHAQATRSGTPGLVLRTICDLTQERLKAAKEVFGTGELRYTHDSADLQNDPDLDLVIIATPPNSHTRLALQMLESGKHVIVEKPLSLNSSEVDALREMAKRNHLLIGCHQNRRWDDDYRAIKLALNQGLIGELFYMETFVGGYGHPCGFWHSEELVSGGATFDWGAHYLDWMLDLMPGTIAEVRCTRQNRVWHDITNADQERIQLRYANGYEAEFTHSDLAFIPKPKWYLLGTQGSIVGKWRDMTIYEVDPLHYYQTSEIPPAELGADLSVRRLQGREQVIEQSLPNPPKSIFPFHNNLADHLLLGEPLAVPIQHTARVIAVLETAKRSAEQGGRIEQVEI
jgi:predicted dehydrogenase